MMPNPSIVLPRNYLIVQRNEKSWVFKPGSTVFYNAGNVPIELDLESLLHQFGLTQKEIVYRLFCINAGRLGYYLADLRRKQYYYCGLEWQDIKTKLLELGIGRADPMDEK